MTAGGVDTSSIDTFIDALWLEEGLSKNTLQAYRRDLTLFAQWLQATPLVAAQELHIQGYFAAQHAQTKATTANRRLTVFRRYFRWALREGLVQQDPTLKLDAALVPREYLIVDEKQIRQAVRDGVREIPGVRIEQVDELAVRAAR